MRRATQFLERRFGDTSVSIHALLAESDSFFIAQNQRHKKFLSTLSLRRATKLQSGRNGQNIVSIHALLAESDLTERRHWQVGQVSIHALLAESDKPRRLKSRRCVVSIHALLAESDVKNARSCLNILVSIHALLAESDHRAVNIQTPTTKFLSTLSLRRATLIYPPIMMLHQPFLSTLSLRRATQQRRPRRGTQRCFYPRSPCGERLVQNRPRPSTGMFLSTLSLRRATRKGQFSTTRIGVSIHALLAESDFFFLRGVSLN